MSFKLCTQCKDRFDRDRPHFSSTTICGTCSDNREKFFKEVHSGLKEAFYFSLGTKDTSPMNLCHALERALKDK